MTGLSNLLDLQDVDTEIDRLRHERQSLAGRSRSTGRRTNTSPA